MTDVDQQRRALSTVRGVRDAIDLDVARQLLAADADGEDRQLLGLQAEQRVGERRLARVRAVGHQHDAGDRQPGQLFTHAVERRADLRLRAGEGQVLDGIHAAGRGREAERRARGSGRTATSAAGCLARRTAGE